MQVAWLVYDEPGKIRNWWFIQEMTKAMSNRGIELKTLLDFEVKDALKRETPLFAIVRTINPKLSLFLENNGILVVNNSSTSRICNNKYETYRFCQDVGFPCLETKRFRANGNYIYPSVMKSVDGHGGSEVFEISSLSEARSVAASYPDKKFIIQPLCDEPGKDLRIYMIGSKIIGSVLRTSHEDFRSNYSLGGCVQAFQPDDDLKRMAITAAKKLHSTFIGVDFIRNQGSWVLNEIEDVVGSRMLYATSDVDFIGLFADEIIKSC